MARYGQNPFGENLWRLVWSDSRTYLVCGQWNDSGAVRAQECLCYPQIRGQWILERWLSAWDYTRMLPSQWDASQENILGPYPSRGEYVLAGDGGLDPGLINFDLLIPMIEAGAKMSWGERLAACHLSQANKDKEYDRKADAIIRNAFPAFGGVPFSQLSTGAGGLSKSTPELKTANELGLPVYQPSANRDEKLIHKPMIA